MAKVGLRARAGPLVLLRVSQEILHRIGLALDAEQRRVVVGGAFDGRLPEPGAATYL